MELVFKNSNFKWIDCAQPDEATMKQLTAEYKLDQFLVADTLEPGHLPKHEEREDYQLVIIRYYEKGATFYHNIIRQYSNKISIFLGKDFIITVHMHPIPFLETEKNKMKSIEKPEAVPYNQILYKICKAVMNTYQDPAHQMAEEIDNYESNIFIGNQKKMDLKALYQIKREASSCKKVLSLNLDALKEVQFNQKRSVAFKDIIELNLKMMHMHSQNLEDAQNLMSLTMGISDQKANEIMKLLTTFSVFFLPLSFIAGWYGMNFKYMPELEIPMAYPAVLILMLLVVIFIFIWFKRKKIL